MADKFDKATRSKIMSKIRSKNTNAELTFRKELYRQGIRGYRVHKKMMGNPDIVFTKKKVVVFIDGDFWHGYIWKFEKKAPPKKYWQEKIQGNINRDKNINKQLIEDGWCVLSFWEHEIKEKLDSCVNKVKIELNKR